MVVLSVGLKFYGVSIMCIVVMYLSGVVVVSSMYYCVDVGWVFWVV